MQEYSLTFGQSPINLIERKLSKDEIISDFLLDFPVSHAYIISGIRGSGKTVLLSNIFQFFKEREDWIVVDVNPEKEILSQIVSNINESDKYKKISAKFSISLSFHGFGVSIEGKDKISDIKIVLSKMLDYLKKSNIKLLVTIDEVSNTKIMRSFAHDFQSLIRENYDLFLLMTGLNENVKSLQNSTALTFLLRTPKIELEALNIESIKDNYEMNFNISDEEAYKLAKLTKGYAFAFQVIGLLYKKYGNIDSIFNELDIYLTKYAYNKIWEKIPASERKILSCFVVNESTSSKNIIDTLKLNEKEYSVYRDRLIKRGVIISTTRGEVELALPRFSNFIAKQL